MEFLRFSVFLPSAADAPFSTVLICYRVKESERERERGKREGKEREERERGKRGEGGKGE